MANSEHDQVAKSPRTVVKKVEAVCWGLFFIWIGLAFIFDIGWGAGLLGVGVIALGSQMARKSFGIPVERFGVAIGIVFILWGAWELLNFQIPGGLLPILLIGVGIALVASALLRKPRL